MKHPGVVGMGLALAAVTVAGCSGHEASSDANPTAVSPTVRAYAEGKFTQYADYLKGLGKIATDTHLVIVSGDERFTCRASSQGPASIAITWSNSEYCPSQNAVVLTAGTINTAIYDGEEDAEIDFTLGHEDGHARQEEKGELQADMTTKQRARIEEQATCYGGQEVERFDPGEVQSIEGILATTPMDPDHGSSMAQATAFMQGAQEGGCPLKDY